MRDLSPPVGRAGGARSVGAGGQPGAELGNAYQETSRSRGVVCIGRG